MSGNGAPGERLSSAQVHELLDRSPVAVYRYRTADPRGFEFVSAGITAIVGYTPEDHYADPDLGLRLAHDEDHRIVARALEGDLDRTRLTMRWVHRDGRTVWTEQELRLERRDGVLVAIEGTVRALDAAPAAPAHELVAGDLRLDLTGLRVEVGGRSVGLTPSEHRLLSLLASRDGVVPRPELVRHLWDSDYTANERVLDVHVSNLRRKLRPAEGADDPIETVKGRGYRLRR